MSSGYDNPHILDASHLWQFTRIINDEKVDNLHLRSGARGVLGSPKPIPWFSWFMSRAHRTQHTIVLMVVNHYSKKTQKNRQREKADGSIWKKPGSSFQISCPVESHRMHWTPLSGKLHKVPAPRVLTGGQSWRPLRLAGHSRLPEWKQVFRINHMICTV